MDRNIRGKLKRMDFNELKPTDFKLTTGEFYDSFDDRAPVEEADLVITYTYTSQCKIFGKIVPLKITLWDPTESFQDSLIRVKNQLQWVVSNKASILTFIAARRKSEPNKKLFNSKETENMDDDRFIKFLTLSEVRISHDYAITLKFNEYDNLPGIFFLFDISSDKRHLNFGSGC